MATLHRCDRCKKEFTENDAGNSDVRINELPAGTREGITDFIINREGVRQSSNELTLALRSWKLEFCKECTDEVTSPKQ